MKQSLKNLAPLFVAMLGLIAVSLANHTRSANLTDVSVTLSNSRPSFSGMLYTGNTVGSSQVIIDTTPNSLFASTSSAQLLQDDTVSIGASDSLGDYTVTSTPTDQSNIVNITPVLLSGDEASGSAIISTQSATLTVKLTTANAIPNGRFRILVPAVDNTANAEDGLPDAGYFDFSNSAPTVTCPADITGYDFVSGTASAAATAVISVAGTYYHAFECAYSGSGAIDSDFNGVEADVITIDSLINPAPKSNHTLGYADSHKIIVQHIDSSFVTQDTTSVAVGVVEAVKVTASVAPQINFRIIGVNSGASACGLTTSVTTTATSVPLGELSIASFVNAAQTLTVSTNATAGYAVTALANDQLGKDGNTCTGDPTTNADCIPDSRGNDGTSMSHTNEEDWDDPTDKGFAFSIQPNPTTTPALTPAFSYDAGTGNCDGVSDACYRQFADSEDSQTAQTIFSNNDVADNANALVCYKAIISNTQAAGDYENYITYTATATF